MAFLIYMIFLFTLPSLLYLLIIIHISRNKNNIIPTNWPIFGMVPKAIANSHRIHDYITGILEYSGGTFLFKSCLIMKVNRLCTTNPLDVHHILSKNFNNYPRGDVFQNIFDVLGDGFTNTDGDIWDFHHKTIKSLLKSTCFQSQLEYTVWNKVEEGLRPILEYVSKQEVEIDLQDVFQRFSFDTICKLLFDNDPKSLSLGFPNVPSEKALSDLEEAILFRYILPSSFWKFQQLLGIGNEKKLSDAVKTVDEFIYKYLAKKQDEITKFSNNLQEEKFKLSASLMKEYKDHGGTSGDPIKFLRDTLLNLIVAGRDTTSSSLSWLFYLLDKNPKVEDKIHEEIHTQLKTNKDDNLKDFHAIELGKLVYLHGALLEALRLFPPVPFQVKTPSQPDVLPSGQKVDQNTMIVLSFYSMGRMKSIWGIDCMDFKPERWISTDGRIIHEPSYKFTAFNAGPRTCLGKQMSFTQMKIVAATIIYQYHVDVVEGHLVFPSDSILLKMKNGLKVRLTKRSKIRM
ncbi:alkane hydroxylase MAH1-like [Rutidosis leptorrhynchoides]|uniref:alkane hydroxylase MAH1-like n=1 Tax=Rutidosis leptorrhynchoides TaxID=125765 RepID=UPI003A98EB67